MPVVVVGASGGTGKAVVRASIDGGISVKALVRRPGSVKPRDGLRILESDVRDRQSVMRSISAGDAVVVSLGNSQNPLKRKLGERRTTSPDICEAGTLNVIAAMTASGARRLIVVSAFGIGSTRKHAPWHLKLFYTLLLREHMTDKERQEALVKASALDWTIVQPLALTDGEPTGRWQASRTGDVGGWKISRDDLAAFIVTELREPANVGATVTLSSAARKI